MWSRRDLKQRAKEVLRGNYWKALLISLVIALATGSGSGGSGGNGNNRSSVFHPDSFPSVDFFRNILLIIFALIAIIVIVAALRILLGYPLEVGGRKYFIQSAQYKDNRRCFRFAFNERNYFRIVLTMLLKDVQNFLWFLLFIIPGIIKLYAYRMVPYILADNPNIGSRKAIRISNKMTYGHKFDMFILDLSFIGWYLLGLLAFVVGVIFVMPYENATKAELYLTLRQNAIAANYCNREDFLMESYNGWN